VNTGSDYGKIIYKKYHADKFDAVPEHTDILLSPMPAITDYCEC